MHGLSSGPKRQLAIRHEKNTNSIGNASTEIPSSLNPPTIPQDSDKEEQLDICINGCMYFLLYYY